ncbi:MAG TPA: hypothetical protein VID50_05595, partial [Candidatus Eisenbacteria bacterium]
MLRRPIQIEEARSALRRRLRQREADFLELARWGVYENPESPYHDLLRLAGCELGDLQRLVAQEGLEEALRRLYAGGVYLTVDELKGRRAAIRGRVAIRIDPARLLSPRVAPHLLSQTSGSRGTRSLIPISLPAILDRAVDLTLILDAHQARDWRLACWGVPGGSALAQVLEYGAAGIAASRWFSPIDPRAPGLHPRYRWSVHALRLAQALSATKPLPAPRHVVPDEPTPILRWMAQVLTRGETPHLMGYPSAVVRLCRAAAETGLDIARAVFTSAGEPMTSARLGVIERTGARMIPRYSSVESGPIAYGCLAREAPDDLHLLRDLVALIQPRATDAGRGGAGWPESPVRAGTLLLSTLRASAPLILINASLGDQAVLRERHCGCPLEALGWTTHLQDVRSHEKLTAGGMTFLDTDLIRVLEEVLPTRFGGAPTDYQLVEEEAPEGQPRLRLLVHPRVGTVDPDALAEAFLSAIGSGTGSEHVMALLWRDAKLLRVER